ncbi:MAG: restriction endonuclease [Anaerolineaceae bacterium]
MNTFLELMITVGRFAVGLWPLMFLAVLFGVVKRRKGFGAVLRTSVNALMLAWAFFALLNLAFYFFKMDTFHLLPVEVNMKYFLSVGLILLPFEVAIVLEQRHKRINAETLEELKALSPSDFEKLVAETYRAQGHKVEIVGSTGDHGIDLVVKTRKGETWIVQCKKYRGKVGEPVIRDFYGALRASDADAGAVITTGLITSQARLWADGKPIFLYDGDEFLDVMRTTRIRKSLPLEAIKKATPAPSAVSASPMSMPMMQTAFASATIASAPVVAAPSYEYTPAKVTAAPELVTAYAVSPAVSMDIPEAYDEYPPQDKRPFMNMDTAPVCPACGVPMILHSEKRLLFKPKEEYICQNAPSCPETMPLE